MEWTEIIPAVAIIAGAILLIARTIVKLTPSTKDDEVVEKVASIVEPVIDKFDGEPSSKSDS